MGESSPCFCSEPILDLSEGLITFLLGFLPFIGIYRLDPDLECAAHWPMIGHLHFMPSIFDLLDPARTSIQ